jgi:hypothetical protein
MLVSLSKRVLYFLLDHHEGLPREASALRREESALENTKFLKFFFLLWVLFWLSWIQFHSSDRIYLMFRVLFLHF